MSADELVARLSKLDSCAVSDALDQLGLGGAVTGLQPMWPCPRIAGYVVTVKLVPVSETTGSLSPTGRPVQHLGTAAIEAASAGDVIVVDHGGRDVAAGWGGILSLA